MSIKRDVENLLGERVTGDFMKYLDKIGYFKCPAAKSHHGSCEGGLVTHSVEVGKQLVNFTEKLNLKWETPESPWVVGLLHDICKTDDYIWNFVNTENCIEMNPNCLFEGHGAKSVLMLSGHFPLTTEETMCITYHMGSFTDKEEWKFYSNAIKMYPNVLYTHMADMIASQIIGV